MKAKKILIAAFVLSMFCTVTAFADSDTYEGFTKATVRVNDNDLAVDGTPAFIINGNTVLSLREASEALQALVSWDAAGKVANIYKPNVSMFFAEDITKDNSIRKPFSRVDQGSNLKFVIFAQVDNLKANVSGFRISIMDPDGKMVSHVDETTDNPGESFWYTSPFEVNFAEAGNYTVKFSFLYNGDYRVVAEKQIESK